MLSDFRQARSRFFRRLVGSGPDSISGLVYQARENFEDDLSLELRRAGPASTFRHGRTLLGGQS